MIDIHSHLIPDFDDGPESFEESLEMLIDAQQQGITDVFATSHFTEVISEQAEKEYFDKFHELKQLSQKRNIRINIYSGSEIFYHHWIDTSIKSSQVTTLGNWGQYILIEFPMYHKPEGADEVLFRLTAEKFIPIVAHVERYMDVLKRPQEVLKFIKYGGLLQVNGGSILGHFGKEIQKIALLLIENRLVHFIASDAHSLKSRPFIMQATREYLKPKISEEYLIQMVYDNPRKIIDQTPLTPAVIPAELEKRGFLSKFRNHLKISF
jgi:protein-tyrosine phosphatase